MREHRDTICKTGSCEFHVSPSDPRNTQEREREKERKKERVEEGPVKRRRPIQRLRNTCTTGNYAGSKQVLRLPRNLRIVPPIHCLPRNQHAALLLREVEACSEQLNGCKHTTCQSYLPKHTQVIPRLFILFVFFALPFSATINKPTQREQRILLFCLTPFCYCSSRLCSRCGAAPIFGLGDHFSWQVPGKPRVLVV